MESVALKQHPDIWKDVTDLPEAARLQIVVNARRGHPAHAQDPTVVLVLDQRPARDRAVDAPHREHRVA